MAAASDPVVILSAAHTPLAAARARGAKPQAGVASLCIGGGEATAIAIESVVR